MSDLIAQARMCAVCMIGSDECHRTDCEKSCIEVIDELADALEAEKANTEGMRLNWYKCIETLKATQAELAAYKEVNPPRVHGEWIDVDDGVMIGDGKHTECSNCHTWDMHREKRAFCPNCGCDMRKEDIDGE